MEQRRVRLGDIVDDYCPRERRLTNHAVVAMIGDQVKQTRCATCDTEHPYKQARVPPKRKKVEVGVLVKEVLERGTDVPRLNGHDDDAVPVAVAPLPAAAASPSAPEPAAEPVAASGEQPLPPPVEPVEDGPVHRPLIRATLPRLEGQAPVRQLPDFTLRLPGARLGQFKHQLGPGFLPETKQKPGRGGQRHAHSHAQGQHRFGHGGRPPGRQGGHKKSPR